MKNLKDMTGRDTQRIGNIMEAVGINITIGILVFSMLKAVPDSGAGALALVPVSLILVLFATFHTIGVMRRYDENIGKADGEKVV